MQNLVTSKLNQQLQPVHLEVINESHMHSGPRDAESHFLVIVVSPVFAGLNRVQRGQKVHAVLKDELSGGIHALSTRLWTPEEWEKNNQQNTFASPTCASKKQSSTE